MDFKKASRIAGMAGAASCTVAVRMAYANYNRARIPTSTTYRFTQPPTRKQMMQRLKSEHFDLVIIGGGASGSGVALDAASRGLKCALVEAEDFASGTSSRSTKLIHGGIRYLQAAVQKLDIEQFTLLCEALTERAHLMTAAPHMAKPLPIMMPVYKYRDIPVFLAGVRVYDWIGKILSMGRPGLPNCFWLSKSNSKFFFPLLKANSLRGSLVYYDGQMNDARLNLSLALTSAIDSYVPGMQPAAVVNHCKVHSIKLPPLEDKKRKDKAFTCTSGTHTGGVTKVGAGGRYCGLMGRLSSWLLPRPLRSRPRSADSGVDGNRRYKGVVSVEDKLTGEQFDIRTTAVVNCTGPYGDITREKFTPTGTAGKVTTDAGAAPKVEKLLKTSAGSHIVLPHYYSSPVFGMIIPETTDGRVLFYVPWENNTLAGTTDTPSPPVAYPTATDQAVSFVVDESCRYLSVEKGLLRKDIQASWAGLRPLVCKPAPEGAAGGEQKLAAVSRTHEIVVDKHTGAVSLMGGKWTTYRRMAEECVDKVVELYSGRLPRVRKARTKFMLLSNAINNDGRFLPTEINYSGGMLPVRLVHKFGLQIEQARHLVRNYGFRAVDLCELGEHLGLLDRLVPDLPYLRAEVVYAVRNEMACTPVDVLARRLRIAFTDVKAATGVLEEVIEVMSSELKWSAATTTTMRTNAAQFIASMQGGLV